MYRVVLGVNFSMLTLALQGFIDVENPLLIHTFDKRAFDTVSALRDPHKSKQICWDFENTRSTETLVAGMARKSQAIRKMVGNETAWACQAHVSAVITPRK